MELWGVVFSFMKHLAPILAVLILLGGCELFAPREAEPPLDTTDPYAWIPPTAPEIVLDNLKNSFPAGKTNYFLDVLKHDQGLTPDFVFVPDAGIASSQPGVFNSWGYVEEETFITKLFESLQTGGFQRLIWDVEQISPLGDTYEIIADYHLVLSYSDGATQLPAQLGGQATLTIIQNNDLLYEISRWEDLNADTLSCWTELKAQVQ